MRRGSVEHAGQRFRGEMELGRQGHGKWRHKGISLCRGLQAAAENLGATRPDERM